MDFNPHELMEVFLAEAEECLRSLESGVLELEQRPDEPAVLDEIFRAAHTLKGNSSSLGFQSMAAFAHDLEDVLDRIRRGERHPDAGLISLILRVVDALTLSLPGLEFGSDRAMTNDEVALYEALRDASRGSAGASPEASFVSEHRHANAGGAPARPGIRVDAARMDALLDLTGEIAVSAERVRRLAEQALSGARDVTDALEDHERLLQELHGMVMRVRLIPVGPLFRRHIRTVRDLASAMRKKARLVIEGGETEVDMTVLEALADPLMHMMRNALDHGIETPESRRSGGKSETGTVTLRAFQERGELVVQIADDGAGISRAKVRQRGEQKGHDVANASDRDLLSLVFQPGFTTASSVTDTSGRGVGMDVVRRNIESVRGDIQLESIEGAGTTVTVRLPMTLAVIPGFRVSVGAQAFVIPMAVVDGCIEQPIPEGAATGVLHSPGGAIPFARLSALFGVERHAGGREIAVIVRYRHARAAFVVDEVQGEAQTVIKRPGAFMRGLPGISGTAVIGNGAVAMVLDTAAIFKELENDIAAVA